MGPGLSHPWVPGLSSAWRLLGWQYIRPICVVEGWVVHRLAGWRGARCKWVVYNHPVRTVYGMILKDLV